MQQGYTLSFLLYNATMLFRLWKNALSVICGLCDNSGVKFQHLILSVQLAPTADSKVSDSVSIHAK